MNGYNSRRQRSALLLWTALASTMVLVDAAQAQAPLPATTPPASEPQEAPSTGLEEIVVTAQRREQSLQDVPVAVTAISAATLQANRVFNVADLSGLAPNVIVRPATGGVGLPSFTIRGVVSYGVTAGSDKQVSVYVDGVYLGSPRGSIFDLPDIERIEVLRGPQGTLFGRNATAGAVSVVTRNPTGKAGARQEITLGNYDQFRSLTSIDLPAWGPFSAYLSYVHDERRGDIRNTGAGTSWNRTGPQTNIGIETSPKYLGDKNAESVFAAVRFEPSDSFDTTYKFSRSVNDGSPEGVAFLGHNPAQPLIGNFLTALINSQATPVLIASDGKRPKEVNNPWASRSKIRATGHNLTSKLEISDSLSATNIAAYRKSYVNASSQIDGLGLTFTPQALAPYATFVAFSSVPGLATAPAATQAATIQAIATRLTPVIGQPVQIFNSTSQSTSKQWSDELQFNYDSNFMTATFGGLYYHSKDRSGGPLGLPNSIVFAPVPGFVVPLGDQAVSYNKATSIAAYGRAEFHVTEQIDLVAGGRVTRDKKSGTFVRGGTFVPSTSGSRVDGTFTGFTSFPFTYTKTKPSYEVGVNYKPNNDLLVYAKYSTAFVSGGSVAGVDFAPETAKSLEAGVKADLLDRRLRTNLSVFDVHYANLQTSQGGQVIGRPEIGTIIVPQGNVKARGFEFEATALPVDGLTLGGSLGFTDVKFGTVNPVLIASGGGTRFAPTLIPKWTYSASAQYVTQPLFGDAHILARVDANGRSKQRTDPNPDNTLAFADLIRYSSASVLVNARLALQEIAIGPVAGELAVWGRNINNNRATTFPLRLGSILASSTFQQARTYGVDLIVKF